MDTGADTRPGRNRPGADTTNGTRADPSKKLILYQSPRSPSMSPWSLVRITTVSSRRPVCRSTSISLPMWSSTYEIAP